MLQIPPMPTSKTVPPFDELTTVIFGQPGSGKTCFAAGCRGSLFLTTEPNQIIHARAQSIKDWQNFRDWCGVIAKARDAGGCDVTTVVVDIVWNVG